MTMKGPEKAAVLLALVGEEIAADLVGMLDEREVVMLRQGLHHLSYVEKNQIEEVYDDIAQVSSQAGLVLGEDTEYLKRILTSAFGNEKADELLKRILQGEDDGSGLESLREMDSEVLATFLRDEHPQTVAFILAHLYPGHAGEILTQFSEDIQREVAYRFTQIARTPPEVIEQVSQVMRDVIRQVKGREVGGVQPLSQVLNYVDKSTEERILNGLNEIDEELPPRIRELMFVFDDLSKIDDRSMQTLIREVERDKWTLALRAANAEFKEKVFQNMSQRAGDLLKEEMEGMGPARLKDIELVQREIVDIARQLEEDGQIMLTTGKGGAEDTFV